MLEPTLKIFNVYKRIPKIQPYPSSSRTFIRLASKGGWCKLGVTIDGDAADSHFVFSWHSGGHSLITMIKGKI